MKLIDLHVHTSVSDGSYSPSEIVTLAENTGLSAIAITDHDAISGYYEASEAAGKSIEVIPGIEFNTKFKTAVHILGYYIDPDNRPLKETIQSIIDDRDIRNEKVVSLMKADGINITYSEMKQRFGEIVGRPHFSEILIENGIVSSVDEAFKKYFNKDKKYWVPRTTLSIETCISLILGAGGIPVIAHPFEYNLEKVTLNDLISECIKYGVMGIECRHSSHTPGQMAYLENLADDYGLLKTGGSDFHGTIKPDIKLGSGKGSVSVPYAWLEKLKNEKERI